MHATYRRSGRLTFLSCAHALAVYLFVSCIYQTTITIFYFFFIIIIIQYYSDLIIIYNAMHVC